MAALNAPYSRLIVRKCCDHHLLQRRIRVAIGLTGSNACKEIELAKSLTTLCKPGVQVAVIARRPHGYFLTHVEGASFPVVNGKSLDAQAQQLADHDVIELAGIKMEFFLKN